jgi:hypothetical protein
MVGDSPHVPSGIPVDRQQRGTFRDATAINIIVLFEIIRHLFEHISDSRRLFDGPRSI